MPRPYALAPKAVTVASRRHAKGEPVPRIAADLGVNPTTLRKALIRRDGVPAGTPASSSELIAARIQQTVENTALRQRAHAAINQHIDQSTEQSRDPAATPTAAPTATAAPVGVIAQALGVPIEQLREVSDSFLRRRLSPYRNPRPASAPWPASDITQAARAYLNGPGRSDPSHRGFLTWLSQTPYPPTPSSVHAALGSWSETVREHRPGRRR